MKLSLKRETLHGLSSHGLSSIHGLSGLSDNAVGCPICPDPIEIIPGYLTDLNIILTIPTPTIGPACSTIINGCTL